jgi:hypothetical protein
VAAEHGFQFVDGQAGLTSAGRTMKVQFKRTPSDQETAALAAGQQPLPLQAGEEQHGPASLSDDGSEEATKPPWYQK